MVNNINTEQSVTDKLPVIIVNHNSADLTIACIQSLEQQHKKLHLDFVVLDNGAYDQTVQLKSAYPNISCQRLLKNLGFADAVNQGMQQAKASGSEFALILNPDTYCESEFVSQLVSTLKTDQKIAAASPLIVKPNGQVWYGGGRISIIKGGPYHLTTPASLTLSQPAHFPQDFVSCCCLLVSIEAFCSVGGLPELYFLYFEDAELSLRLRRAGYVLTLVQNCQLVHHVSATTNPKSSHSIEMYTRNRIWFMYRNYPKSIFIVFMLFNCLIRLPAAVLYFLVVIRSPKSALAFCRGLRAGIGNRRQSQLDQLT